MEVDPTITIKRLHWSQWPGFLALRRSIEREAQHLVASPGERRERLLISLARLWVTRRHTTAFIAEDQGVMHGYATVIFARFRKMRGNCYLTVSVQAARRGKGIGTRLIAAAEEEARARGARRIELEVFAQNDAAIRLYERLGYVREGLKKDAVESADGFDDMVLMAKRL